MRTPLHSTGRSKVCRLNKGLVSKRHPNRIQVPKGAGAFLEDARGWRWVSRERRRGRALPGHRVVLPRRLADGLPRSTGQSNIGAAEVLAVVLPIAPVGRNRRPRALRARGAAAGT